MRFGDGLTRLRELLQEQRATHWSDSELGGYLNRHVHSLVRKMTELDEGYHNFHFTLLAANARQVKSDEFEYTVPSWCMKVTAVHELTDTSGSPLVNRGVVLGYANRGGAGWLWRGMNTFALRGVGAAAKDLDIYCAKRPARLTKGTLPLQTSMSTSQMRLDTDTSADAVKWPHETLQNSYANAIIEITGSTARSGQIGRVTSSTHFVDLTGTRYTELGMESAWAVAPAPADTYEMHFEIPEEHMNLVLLMAANTAWATRGNTDEQKGIAAELANEYKEFEAHIRPRQLAQPGYLRYSASPSYGLEPNRTEDTRRPLWV